MGNAQEYIWTTFWMDELVWELFFICMESDLQKSGGEEKKIREVVYVGFIGRKWG